MWGIVLNGQLIEIIKLPKAVMINDIQHPQTIFTRAWTDEERKSIGILPYVYSGSDINNEFYKTTFSDTVGEDVITRTYTNTPVSDLSSLKSLKINQAKSQTKGELSQTDWYVIRNSEVSTAIPSEITAYRSAMRSNYDTLKTAITNAADVDALYSYISSANSDESITIDGTSSSVVSTSANSITSNAHGFVVGEILIYDNGGGADIGGLVHETQYYVYSKTVNTFKLSHSHSNCGDAAIISLSSVASSGTSHTFKSSGVPGAGNTWPNPNASIYTV